MLRVVRDGSGRTYRVRQVDIDYPTAEAAAEVLVDLYEQQLRMRFGPERRPGVVGMYAGSPGMSTDPMTPDGDGDHLTVLRCDESGEACIGTGNAWGEQKIAMRKALGMW
ncbi:hypothetical protein Cs7R123_02200 [Catellatospora sp. TT07R-123]|nr:hypothetical protein Cs7R123_02200 [Catellatospora sp. TT07R-123]